MKIKKTTKHKLMQRLTAFITMLCMVFTMLPINALAFNPDWYKTHITSVSIGKPTTDLNGKKYLPVTVNFLAEEDIGDTNAVYFLEGYLLATLKNGTKAEGIVGNGMTLMGPLMPDAPDGAGANAFSWVWTPGQGLDMGSGKGVLKYNIPLLDGSATQTVEKSPYTGQQEVNGLKVGDQVSFKIETVMNTNTIPADVLPEGGSLMSDEFTVVIEDVSQYPKDITTSGGSCKHDGEKSYSKYTPEQHKVYCNKCDQEIGTEDHDFSQHLTGYQVTYSISSKFTKAATKSVNVKGTSKVISKLTKGKTYYVKVRTYKTVGKTKYYSGYSAVKKITVK